MNTPAWYEQRSRVTGGRELLELDVPVMSLGERDRRWAALREKLYVHGLDGLILFGVDAFSSTGTANVRYLTQLAPIVGAYAVFPLDGDPAVLYGARHMHLPAGPWQQVSGAWVADVRPDTGVGGLIELVREKGLEGKRVGIVGYRHMLSPMSNVPASLLEALRDGLGDTTITDATSLIDEMRVIKSAEEIEFLRRAGAIATKRIETLIDTARPGATEAEVWAAMEYTGIVNGAEPCTFNFLSSGPVEDPEGRIVNLLHGSEPPFTATPRVLAEGDLVISEFHTSYGGYLAGTEFSVHIGEPPPELARLHEAAVEIVGLAGEVFEAGRPLREVYSAFHAHVDARGIDFLELGFHGHGLASPEFPAVVHREADLIEAGNGGFAELRLREGMVFALNIDIHDPAWRRDVGVMLGDMLVVTSGAPELLCEIPLDVFAVDSAPSGHAVGSSPA